MDINRIYSHLPFVICTNGMTREQTLALVEKYKRIFGASYRFSQEVFEECLDESIELASVPSNFIYGPYVGVHNHRPTGELTLYVSDAIPEGSMVINEQILDSLNDAGYLAKFTRAKAS